VSEFLQQLIATLKHSQHVSPSQDDSTASVPSEPTPALTSRDLGQLRSLIHRKSDEHKALLEDLGGLVITTWMMTCLLMALLTVVGYQYFRRQFESCSVRLVESSSPATREQLYRHLAHLAAQSVASAAPSAPPAAGSG